MRPWLALVGLLAFGCAADESLGGGNGDPAPDGPVPDTGVDGATSDAPADVQPADASPADAPPDVAAPDLGVDGPSPDGALPDATPPDAAAPDAMSDGIAGADMGTDGPPSCVPVPGTPPLGLELIDSGFSSPVDIQSPPGDPRLFIVEQGGIIHIIDGGVVLATPFLDISGQVSGGSEQGLLGLAFHPGYAANGRFFVDYTDTAGDTQVSEFAVSIGDPNVADPTSERSVLSVSQPFANHNG